MVKNLTRKINVLISCALIFQLAGCGTIMYPERRGQRDGRIDAGVAVLDGIGLFFFIIPGVIAYAVDFSTGAIYLPGTARSSLDMKDIKVVKFDPEHGSTADISKIIKKETGCDVELDQDNMEVVRLKSTDDMMAHFAQVLPEINNAHPAPGMK